MEIYSDPETRLIKTSWYPCQVGARHKRACGPLRPPTDCWINAGGVAARRLLACCATNTQPRPHLLRSAESWWGAAGSSTKGRILPERRTGSQQGFGSSWTGSGAERPSCLSLDHHSIDGSVLFSGIVSLETDFFRHWISTFMNLYFYFLFLLYAHQSFICKKCTCLWLCSGDPNQKSQH